MKTKHIASRKMLLYLLSDSSLKDRRKIEKHLSGCNLCKKQMNREKGILRIFQQQPSFVPQASVLQKRRTRLMKQLRYSASSNRDKIFWEKFIEAIRPFRLQWITVGVFFFAGLILGRFILLHHERSAMSSREALFALQSSEPISDFKMMPIGEKVEIRFKTVREQCIRGKLNDPLIQQCLSYALENSPGDHVRLRIIDLLGKFKPQNPDVQRALTYALENDDNPGIRLKAIRLLIRAFPINQTIRDVLVHAFIRDVNEGIRIEAANTLSKLSDPNILPLLQKEATQNAYLRSLLMKE